MYQSRMKILKSRDGTSTTSTGRRAKLGEKILNESSFSSSFVDRGTRKPCPSEKLLPPIQLMTKERSFRHLYLKYHPPKIQVRMDFLIKKEDPKFKKKKDDIFARIRASEMASERLKREKELKRNAMNDGVSLGNSLSEQSSNDEIQQENNNNNSYSTENSNTQKDIISFSEDSNIAVSGFVMDPSKKSDSGATVSPNNSGVDDYQEEEVYGDSFAFLAEWKKERKRRASCRS